MEASFLYDSRNIFRVCTTLISDELSSLKSVIEAVFSAVGVSITSEIVLLVYEGMKAAKRLNFECLSVSDLVKHCRSVDRNCFC